MTLRRWIYLALLFCGLMGCGDRYSSGDRVLVSKLSYDAYVTGPKRYEVVVFKYPKAPVENNTPKNYIKRLLGLPGELIAIFFGRLYHRVPEPGAPPFFDDLKDAAVSDKDLWQAQFMHTTDDAGNNVHAGLGKDDKGLMARKWFQEGKFEILRKPPHVMLALRRIVYDNDYQAKSLKGKLDRWAPRAKSAWTNYQKSAQEPGFTFDDSADGPVDWLRYQHLLRPDRPFVPGNVNPSLIFDAMDYNQVQTVSAQDNQIRHDAFRTDKTPTNAYWVGDLMIECNVEITQAKGEFWLELSKGIYRFRARWDLATGQCTLFRSLGKDDKMEELAAQATSVKGPGNYMLRFANIDARLTVWVDRALPFGEGKEYDPPEVRSKNDSKDIPDEMIEACRGPRENDLEPASVGAKGAKLAITQLRLWRDTYYCSSADRDRPDYLLDREGLTIPDRWDPISKSRFATMYVQPGHYLCLGDNSQASSDSRDWGLVPERLLLGRALMVYFPLERVGPIR